MPICPKKYLSQITVFKNCLGYAEDGGLYFPESIPKLDNSQIENWSKLSYPELVEALLLMFIDESEISSKDLKNLVATSFSKFKRKFAPKKTFQIVSK
jgi:threonine synthase